MGKRVLCILLAVLCILPAGCSKNENGGKVKYKIGVVTGSENRGEAFYAAARLAENPAFLVRTYSDEMKSEETVSICTELAEDPAVRAIVFVRAIAGIDEAIRKVKETRSDILFIAGALTEDAGFVAQTADLVLAEDMVAMGREIVNEAYRMGAKKFIHYTFARHLMREPVLRRRETMVARCEELGISFMDITTPDPLNAEGGAEEAKSFILEDVPEQVGNYGANTAFYATDCTIAPELIRAVMESGALYPQPCCPSPFHGFTEALGVDAGGYDEPNRVLREVAAGITPYGNTGHMATWPVSAEILMVEVGIEYARAYCEGKVKKEIDRETLDAIFDEKSGGRATLSEMAHAKNCFLFLCEPYML